MLREMRLDMTYPSFFKFQPNCKALQLISQQLECLRYK